MAASTRLLIAFFGVVILLAALSNAAVQWDTRVWVSNSGNDTTGQGTFESPFQTPERAFQAHPDNVMLTLEDGIYNVSIPAAASNIAVVGEPRAVVNWFIWQQVGVTTPLTIYVANLDVVHENSDLLPLFQLNGQLCNATLQNVNINGSVPSVTQPLATFLTGPVEGSSLTLDNVVIKNLGKAFTNVQIQGFNTLTGSRLEILGHISMVSVKEVSHVMLRKMTLHFSTNGNAGSGELVITKSSYVAIIYSTIIQAILQVQNNQFVGISQSTILFSLINTGNAPTEACMTGLGTVSVTDCRIQDSALVYDVSQSTHGSCPSNAYLVSFKANVILGRFTTTSQSIIDFKGNYWGASTGPYICSNPGGLGTAISYYMDFSAWCTSQDCTDLNNDYPMLLSSVIEGPCQRPTAGAIAVFIVIFFSIVAINVVMLIVYCMYCTPRKTDSESIQIHYGKMTSVMASIAALSLIVLAFSGIVGSAACPTRVYATKCPFTITDRAVGGNGLMFGCLMLLVSSATLMLIKFNLQEQRPILYTSMGYQLLSFVIAIVIVILSLKNLSSSLRGPYMHLLAVPAAGYIVFCILQMYHMEKLRHFCRHTHIALEVSDYKHERARLVREDSSASSVSVASSSSSTTTTTQKSKNSSLITEDGGDSNQFQAGTSADSSSSSQVGLEVGNDRRGDARRGEDDDQSVIDEYTFTTVQPIQVFYSDYQKVTKRWLVAENVIFGILLAFVIWYTVASYRAVGAILITVIILECVRILMAIFITKHRGPILGFKILMTFTALLKLALLAASIFLYVQVFSLTSHNSAYFTASLLAPTFFLGIVSTIRIWKMFEAVHEKRYG